MQRFFVCLALSVAGCSEFELEAVPGTGDPLPATSPDAELTITPDVFNFGSVSIPCSSSTQLTLESTGEGPLEIRNFDYVSSGLLSFDQGAIDLPLVLEPGESRTVTVFLDAETPSVDVGQLAVESNDPRGAQTADQVAEALPNYITETFEEPGIAPVDILFLIDQSCSMEYLADDNIRNGMPDFINTLQGVADWQLIQVIQEDGCATGGIMDDSTANAAQLLADNAFGWVGIFTVFTERLLAHASTALALTDDPIECNYGFDRVGAGLHIIVASDEVDQSFGSYDTHVMNYLNYVEHPDMLKVSGILNLNSSTSCSGTGNSAGPDGYIDAVNVTGGVAIDICTPGWGSQLTDIAVASVEGFRVYNLTHDAVGSTLEVDVNGVPAIDWTWIPSTNSVRVDDPLIGEGDVVEITYGILAECPGA